MKKYLVVLLGIFLIFVMTACNKETKNIDSNTNTNSSGAVSKENNSDNANKDSAVVPGQTNNTTTENIDNGVLEKAETQKMNVPENMKLLASDNANKDNNANNINATVAAYQLDGNVVNWTTENDFIYVITSGNNRLVVIHSKDMIPVANVPLAAKPAEINLIGDLIYISLPDLCRIDVFSKTDFSKKHSLFFEHEVSSFCIDEKYIYYSEHDQWCSVYRKNVNTNELEKLSTNTNGLFYQPKLYLNKKDNILYVGESGYTGSTLYYYDATTLELKSFFKKDNYGITNHTRDIFHVGDEIFWGNYRLSAINAKQLVGRYGEASYGSINFASKELISTYEGLFLTDTYECIINYFDAGFRFEYILVTESKNIFFRSRLANGNVIIGVNFSIQWC